MSTVLPLTVLIKLPLIHINIPASAEINPLNQLSQRGGRDATWVERNRLIETREMTELLKLTWPHHQIWNTTNFALSQSKDLV